MYARVATFEGDPSRVDDAINMVRSQVQSETPAGLEGAKMLMLVNRETGKGIGITLFDDENAMQRGDEALNAMNPEGTERRTSVEFFEVPVETATSSCSSRRLTVTRREPRPFTYVRSLSFGDPRCGGFCDLQRRPSGVGGIRRSDYLRRSSSDALSSAERTISRPTSTRENSSAAAIPSAP